MRVGQLDGYMPQIEGPGEHVDAMNALRSGAGAGLSLGTVTTLGAFTDFTRLPPTQSHPEGKLTTVQVEELKAVGVNYGSVEVYVQEGPHFPISNMMWAADQRGPPVVRSRSSVSTGRRASTPTVRRRTRTPSTPLGSRSASTWPRASPPPTGSRSRHWEREVSLTLAPYVGNGTRRNPFRTALEGASIDLRPDCSKRDGYALVNTQERVRRLKLAEGFKDTFGYRIRNRVHDLLGVDVSRVRRFDVLAAKLLLEPNGWLPLLPTHERFEIWLGGLVWEFPLIRGGASDNFNRADENPLAAPWTAVMGSAARLVSNAVRPDADVMIGYTGSVSSINQYSECVAPNATTQEAGPACRR